ncbi:hypothetical protein Hbl1158_05000 [Halobaculum sp. CBA1158]|uniref:helix-turn-helix transcriptional regulator n=1 Tax=Halobaculum sp. CBA1158 TaxID=2904243 RepID=UPI001F216375|nr:hypothetical protein [Halobaculum sp. CBA1158]UIP00717.1 hypothetical protein Hbl1158_05000 [Halobaculum sp. CBA1158]
MRHLALLAALVLLGSVVAGSSLAAADASPAAPSPTATPERPALAGAGDPAALAIAAPETNFTVSLREDGSARWTVETRFDLADEDERAAFREYADAYEAGTAEDGPSVTPFRNAAREASAVVDREMAIERANRSARITNSSGVLVLQFTWTEFLAEEDDGALALGDAFRTANNGTWFGSLSASQRLVIEPPEGYEVSDVSNGFSYSISDRRIVAEGPQTFEAGDIGVTYEPGATTDEGIDTSLLAGVIVALLVVVAVLSYRRSDGALADVADAYAADESPNDAARGAEPRTGEADERASGAATSSDAGAGTEDGSVDPRDSEEAAVGPTEEELELLSDEERVERLLERHGGRMRQATIVSETAWSDAKVSQLLSAMADEGRVEKLRLGRENLISLADDDGDEDGEDDANDGADGRERRS